jgi:hypothetical protein
VNDPRNTRYSGFSTKHRQQYSHFQQEPLFLRNNMHPTIPLRNAGSAVLKAGAKRDPELYVCDEGPQTPATPGRHKF